MATKIRLKRVGKKKQPSFRIVVVEAARKRDGRTLAEIGHLNLLSATEEITLDVEAALWWLRRGAKPSPAARRLLSRVGAMRAWHEERYGRPSPAQGTAEDAT